MVDEKKLIDELKQSGMIVDNEYGNAMVDIIESQSKISGWVACNDRLPTMEECQKNDNRFILDDGNRRYGGLFDYQKQCFVQLGFYKGLVEDKCAIAWQPLPDPYIENIEDKCK